MRQRAVIFDMDGVLVNSPIYVTQAFDQLLKEHGTSMAELEDGYNEGHRGRTLRDILGMIKDKTGTEIPYDEFSERASALQFDLMTKAGLTATPELRAFLDDLAKSGFKVAIATGSPRKRANWILEKLGLATEFDTIVALEDVTAHKPNPDIFLSAAAKLGLSPSDCVVIEDAAAGVEAGNRAGMTVVGYSEFNEHPETLSAADMVVADFGQLSATVISELILAAIDTRNSIDR